MSGTTAKEDGQKMAEYLRDALGLSQTSKVHGLLRANGVLTLGEMIALCDTEREELYGELKAGGVVLGDRSKMRRATAESIAAWITMQQMATQAAAESPQKRSSLTGKSLAFVSKLFGSTSSEKSTSETAVSDSGAPSSGANSDGDAAGGRPAPTPSTPPRPTKGTGTLQGSPAWWKGHDDKMRRLAMAMAGRPGSDGVVPSDGHRYTWQQQNDSPDYHQLLWDRRAALLAAGFAKDDGMRKEWLALILELDATAGQSGPTFKTPSNGDYPWFNQKGEDGYKKTLLERRSQMLEMNLTQNPSLQSEWVLLMRELEATLQEQPQREQPAPSRPADTEHSHGSTSSNPIKISISRDDMALTSSSVRVTVDEAFNDGKSASVPNSPARPSDRLDVGALRNLNGRSIQQWRTEVARTLRGAESMASLLSEASSSASFRTANADAFSKNDITRVASLASFYADSTRTEDFFTGSEREDSEDADEDDDPEVVFMLPLTGIVDPEDEAGAADGSTIPDQASDTQSQETAKAEA